MPKLLKFRAKMKQGSLNANFMGSQSSVDADADYVFNESDPQGEAKSFEFSFDSSGKLLANGSGENPFNLVVDGPTNPYFREVTSGNELRPALTSMSGPTPDVDDVGDEGGLCDCPNDCHPC